MRARGIPWEEVAQSLRINLRTLIRWQALPGFAAGLETSQRRYLDEQKAKLMFLLPKAVDKLSESLEKGGDTARMKAIELLAKWTGLAGGKTEKPESTGGGITFEELLQRQQECIAALEQETPIPDGD